MIERLEMKSEQGNQTNDWYVIGASGYWSLHPDDIVDLGLHKVINETWWVGKFMDFEIFQGCKLDECGCKEQVQIKECQNSVLLAKIIDENPDINSMPIATCLDNYMKIKDVSKNIFNLSSDNSSY